jgi:formylglycine-generating enzyme required for sulfatase activity
MLPVGGVGWRQAAALCNWLHNGKSADASAFASGAYDISTFGSTSPGTFTDQAQHSPGARYWIPTQDEWMKAVHFDPSGNGGQGRWWEQPNGSDVPLTYGPPPSFGGNGSAQANAGFTLPGNVQYHIPVGAYLNTQSPWGVLDAAGGTREWLEDIRVVDGDMTRAFDGSVWGLSDPIGPDLVWGIGDAWADSRVTLDGFRIASAVPAPSSMLVLMCVGGMCVRRSRRE